MYVYNFYEYSFGNNFDTGLTVTAKSSPAKLRQQQQQQQQQLQQEQQLQQDQQVRTIYISTWLTLFQRH